MKLTSSSTEEEQDSPNHISFHYYVRKPHTSNTLSNVTSLSMKKNRYVKYCTLLRFLLLY